MLTYSLQTLISPFTIYIHGKQTMQYF